MRLQRVAALGASPLVRVFVVSKVHPDWNPQAAKQRGNEQMENVICFVSSTNEQPLCIALATYVADVLLESWHRLHSSGLGNSMIRPSS